MDKDVLERRLNAVFADHKEAKLTEQVEYKKFYLYSIITHSTAIEGSTVTEVENTLLFDQGITSGKRTWAEQQMNLDLKKAYELSESLALSHVPYTLKMLQKLAAAVMKNTGRIINSPMGTYDEKEGEFRLVNVTAGSGGRSYLNATKVIPYTEKLCSDINEKRKAAISSDCLTDKYDLSFDAHYNLVAIHPWSDGNGRMSRLVMNQLQEEMGVLPVKVTKEHKADYIQALIDSREKDSPEPFREFMYAEHIRNIRGEIFTHWKEQAEDFTDAKNATVKYAVKYADCKLGFPWLRDSFNELCDLIVPKKIHDDPVAYREQIAWCVLDSLNAKVGQEKTDFIRADIEALAANPKLGKTLQR